MKTTIMLALFAAIYIAPGCGRRSAPPQPPKPSRNAEIIYKRIGVNLQSYVLSPAERNAVMDILLTSPTLAFVDEDIDGAGYKGYLHVANQYLYKMEYGIDEKEVGQISIRFEQGRRQTTYCWRGERILPLAKRLHFATTDRDIQEAFADFAVQQEKASEIKR